MNLTGGIKNERILEQPYQKPEPLRSRRTAKGSAIHQAQYQRESLSAVAKGYRSDTKGRQWGAQALPGSRLYRIPGGRCRPLWRKAQQVFAGNGSDEVLAFAFGAFFEGKAGEENAILFPDITYSFYPVYADLWGIPFRTVPLDDDFSIRTADYQVPSGGVVFPNPNAPTGRALALADILSLVECLERQGKVFILDEAYAAFGAESAVPYIRKYPNLLTVHTLSKSASLAGLRAGFAIGSEELIEGLCRIRDSFNSYTLDRLALAGATAAVSDAAYYDAINRRVIAARERTAATLQGLGFETLPSAANFILVKAPASIGGAGFFAALRERGILVRHFNKPRIAAYVRVSIGTDEDMDAFLAVCGEITG